MNFTQSMNDQCLLMRNDQNGTIIIYLYIDDTLCVGDKKKPSTYLRKKLKNILLQRKKEKWMTM